MSLLQKTNYIPENEVKSPNIGNSTTLVILTAPLLKLLILIEKETWINKIFTLQRKSTGAIEK